MDQPNSATADRIESALATFCRLHGIDPAGDQAREFYAAILSEVTSVLLAKHGVTVESGIPHYLARNPIH